MNAAATIRTPAQTEDAAIELEREVAEIVQEQTGMNHQFAIPLAQAIVIGMRRRYGAGNLYVPSLATAERDRRDAAMRAMFNGRNLGEVASHFGLSVRQTRTICCVAQLTTKE